MIDGRNIGTTTTDTKSTLLVDLMEDRLLPLHSDRVGVYLLL